MCPGLGHLQPVTKSANPPDRSKASRHQPSCPFGGQRFALSSFPQLEVPEPRVCGAFSIQFPLVFTAAPTSKLGERLSSFGDAPEA